MTDEKTPGRYKVLFHIDKVVKGEFSKSKLGGPSALEQAKDAAKNKEILKLLTLDFSNPEDEVDKELLSVAVYDPETSFGINASDSPSKTKHKLYLKRMDEDADSFILIYSMAMV